MEKQEYILSRRCIPGENNNIRKLNTFKCNCGNKSSE